MPDADPKLFFLCGKMAAGKSTLAAELARAEGAVLLVQDQLLVTLFPGAIVDILTYVEYSARLGAAFAPVVHAILERGVSVVLDFPANTRSQRAWFRALIEQAGVSHELHFVDAPDELCKAQLRERSRALPPGSPFTSDADFDVITAFFQPPAEDERFVVIRHARA